jgi:hypothetical protein
VAHEKALNRKKHGLDVWASVIYYHFEIHMNYTQIIKLLDYEGGVSMSQGTARAICEYFEVSAKHHVDEETLRLVSKNGRIILSLDGAQPKKGRPAFWAFTDRLTGRILLTRYLETASAPVLVDLFKEIEDLYNVPIVAVISDKQRNIVNAVQDFRQGLRHVYCQYHFLHHIREPIAAKDSHLLTVLRSSIKKLSLVIHRELVPSSEISAESPVGQVFAPVAEELLCAVATRGERFKIFPGLEAYENVNYVRDKLVTFKGENLPRHVKRSLDVLVSALQELLEGHEPLVRDITSMILDFNELRVYLSRRKQAGERVKKNIKKWVYKLQSRLKRRKLEHKPSRIKWQKPSHAMNLVDAWQQWVRLVAAYSEGLYHAYDDPDLDFTNNPKESLFGSAKHHFKSVYGREDVQVPFEVHAGHYTRVMEMELNAEMIREVLLATDTALVEAERHDLHARYVTTRRKWQIRDESTGNFTLLMENLAATRRGK